MSNLPATTLVLLAGGAASAAIYWGFLNTPESTVWTLALSAVLLLAVLFVAAMSIGTVLLAWYSGRVSRPVVVGALRGLPAFLLPALLVIAVWWLVGRADAWVTAMSGEISAWFIARFNWSDVGWLFRLIEWLSLWLRWVVAPFVALVWWRTILVRGWKPTGALLGDALHPVRMLVATAIVALLVWVPWTQVAPWRPQGLAPGTTELVFVGAKLGLVALLTALGWSLVARTAARPRARA
jgi:hypothetical protein